MSTRDPKSLKQANLLLDQGLLAHRSGRVAEALTFYQKASELEPSNSDCLHLQGLASMQLGDLQSARKLIERALDINRSDDYLSNYGLLLIELGEWGTAEQIFRNLLGSQSCGASAFTNLIRLLIRRKDFEGGIRLWHEFSVDHPWKQGKALLNLAVCLRQVGRAREGLDLLDSCVGEIRDDIDFLRTEVSLYAAIGDQLGLQRCLRKLDANTKNRFEFLLAQAEAANIQSKYKEAIDLYTQCLELNPENTALISILTALHIQLKNPRVAIKLLKGLSDETLAKKEFKNLMFQSLMLVGEMDQARACLLDPSTDPVTREIINLFFQFTKPLGVVENEASIRPKRAAAIRAMRKAKRIIQKANLSDLISSTYFSLPPFFSAYELEGDYWFQRAYYSLSKTITTKLLAEPLGGCQNERTEHTAPTCSGSKRKVKILFITQFSTNHSGVRGMWGLVCRLPKDEFDITYVQVNEADARPQVEALSNVKYENIQVTDATFKTVFRRLKFNNADVIIYPELGMSQPVWMLSTHKLAPLVLMGWGHPVTSGGNSVDYFVTSRFMEPETNDKHYAERTLVLPGTGVDLDPLEEPSGTEEFKRRHKLPQKFYVCVQSLFKLHPKFDDYYTTLIGITDAPLYLIGSVSEIENRLLRDRWEKSYERQFKRPIEPDKVNFLPRLTAVEFRLLLKLAYLNIDSVGWSGGFTTLDAISVGCPTLTVRGTCLRGNHSVAYLNAIGGLEKLICESCEVAVSVFRTLDQNEPLRNDLSQQVYCHRNMAFVNKRATLAFEEFLRTHTKKGGNV